MIKNGNFRLSVIKLEKRVAHACRNSIIFKIKQLHNEAIAALAHISQYRPETVTVLSRRSDKNLEMVEFYSEPHSQGGLSETGYKATTMRWSPSETCSTR